MLHVTIEPMVLAKILHWVRRADKNEVSGFGKIISYNGNPHVIEAVLVNQINTPGSTEIDAVAMGRAMYQLRDMIGHFNYWWHSHGHGSAYFSKTDYDTIESLGGRRSVPTAHTGRIAGSLNDGDAERSIARADDQDIAETERNHERDDKWIVATVFNVIGDTRSAILSTAPIRLFSDGLLLRAESALVNGCEAEWDKEYDGTVRIRRHERRRHRNRKAWRDRRHASRANEFGLDEGDWEDWPGDHTTIH